MDKALKMPRHEVSGVWVWESGKPVLKINGVKVAEFDSSGNLKIKGDIWANESL